MKHKPDIMTLEEVAEYLRISERTVYDWAQKGDIPCGKIGTAWRFLRSDIEKWVVDKLGAKPVEQNVEIKLSNLLSEEKVMILDSVTKEEALDAMIDMVSKSSLVTSKKALKEGIYRREELMSTGIGQGVAIPHVRIKEVKDLVVGVAVCGSGIPDYESLDAQPVQLLFMIVARDDQHALHLKTLAAISSVLKNQFLKNMLLSSTCPKDFMEVIKNHEK